MPLSVHPPPRQPSLPIRPRVPPQPVRRISAWPFLSGRDEAPAGDVLGNARRVIALTARLYQEPMQAAASPQARKG